ncbi:hypothetical protein [Legionella longbeachae]|uniref:hypothetical protein n=1 Tax=Legionella longbeachae TaxID=450 RepID=UPI001245712D|nr:hypothetical protein [Legionella longbeachae]QEY49917.1 hypothetical protein FQU71_00890 [Legionella longbeachae]
MPHLAIMPPEDVIRVVKPKIEDLQRITAMNTQIIVDTKYEINIGLKKLLKSGRINELRYEEELKQNKKELILRQKALNELEQQFQRIKQLQEEAKSETICFVIENDINIEELKKLIALTQINIDTTDDKNEKLFLCTLLQTAISCKNLLDEQRTLTTQKIPMLKSEKRYTSYLLEELKNFELNPSKSPLATDSYITKLDNPGLSNSASHEESIIELDALISQMDSMSTGFKEFINKFCNTINKEPIFALPESSMNNKVQDFKEQLKLIKTETEQKQSYANTR